MALTAVKLLADQTPADPPQATSQQTIAASQEQHPGAPTEGFQLGLAFTKVEFGLEEPVVAVVTTRNASDRPLFFVSNVPHYLQFLMVDAAGKRVSSRSELQNETPFAQRLRKTVNNPKYMPLKPGEHHEDRIDLRKSYDLPPGEYTVSVTRIVPMMDDPRAKSQVMSGNVSLKTGSSSTKTGESKEVPKSDTSKLFPGQPLEATLGIDQKHVAQTGGQARVEADASPGHQTEPGVNFPAPPVGVAVGNGGRASRMYFYAGVAIVLAMLPFVALLMRGRKSKRVEDSQK
jgi:hypothetical protein